VASGCLGALALAASGLAAPAVEKASARPNVVVVMTDDQDVKAMGVMTKTLRQLGAQGTTFRRFFATTPRCCPSRATFLTGQYAHNHGVRGGAGGFSAANFQEFRDGNTLPVALKRVGYRTGYVGKYLNGYGDTDSSERYIPPGWDSWRAPVRGTATHQFGYVLNENRRLRRYGSRTSDYQTDVYARKAVAFIDGAAASNRPFFLTVAPSAPHGERGLDVPRSPRPAPRDSGAFEGKGLPSPPSFNERDVSDKPSFIRRIDRLGRSERTALRERYQDRLASLLAVDDAVAKILGSLRRTGELRNTVVMLTSDNGYLLGEHRLTDKTVLYEESARVPLIVRGPGFPRGARRGQITGNIDLAPTILDLADAEALRTMDGISLLPLARDPSTEQGRDILLENKLSAAVRTPRFMYARHSNGEQELYDLGRDPYQLESRHDAAAYQGRRAALEARLLQLRDCAGETCR
jgi:arylsulfatase A-like enzyme